MCLFAPARHAPWRRLTGCGRQPQGSSPRLWVKICFAYQVFQQLDVAQIGDATEYDSAPRSRRLRRRSKNFHFCAGTQRTPRTARVDPLIHQPVNQRLRVGPIGTARRVSDGVGLDRPRARRVLYRMLAAIRRGGAQHSLKVRTRHFRWLYLDLVHALEQHPER